MITYSAAPLRNIYPKTDAACSLLENKILNSFKSTALVLLEQECNHRDESCLKHFDMACQLSKSVSAHPILALSRMVYNTSSNTLDEI